MISTARWAGLDENDRAAFRAAVAFLNRRFSERNTIDWALRLKPSQHVELIAIHALLNSPSGRLLEEPWATAWRLIEEGLSSGAIEEESLTAIYDIRRRLSAGDRSGAIISAIVDLVAPRLKVEPVDPWRWRFTKKPRRPKTFDHLLSANLTSGKLIDLNVIELAKITEVPFLKALANALDGVINHGLDVARRLGWDGQHRLWQLGSLNRAYYVPPSQWAEGGRDPDAHQRGIAPSVKLLHAVLSRVAEIDGAAASSYFQRWRLQSSPIHLRLWAAFAPTLQLIAVDDIGEFLLQSDDREFWDLQVFPEIAEARTLRFGRFDLGVRNAIFARLIKGPPRKYWPRKADAEKVKNARLYWAIRELKRIELAGGRLSSDATVWMQSKITQFPDFASMTIDGGFPEGVTTHWVSPNPDNRYDTLSGVARLRALEAALSTSRGGWDEDPAERANDWLRQSEKTAYVLSDLESTENGGDEFPLVWNRFGWAHSPRETEPVGNPPRNLQSDADRVLALLQQLSTAMISSAIDGVANWLDAWKEQVVTSPLGLPIWLRIWPIAVDATNAMEDEREDTDLSVSVRSVENDREPMDLDTLNTPAGKLVGVFLSNCPRLGQGVQNAFDVGSAERQMRDVVVSASGRSGLIARHRLIEVLAYFLHADRDWAQHHLIAPLLADDNSSLALWRAIARRTHSTQVLRIIGGAMTEMAADRRLGRETRSSLVFSLVVEAMHAFREDRDPAVPNPRTQQMLRSLDDEVRATAAGAIQRFVRDLSHEHNPNNNASSADLFRSAAAPFLRQVWPQERSLATPGVSRELADLPAASGDAFAEAVEAIERFLVPFDCWSMISFGLYGDDDGVTKLSRINDERKARAFLRLLDLTIGSSEGAVVPDDLTEALDRIRVVAPALVENPAFRRLSTAARR